MTRCQRNKERREPMWFLYNKRIIFDKIFKKNPESLQNTQRLWYLRRERGASGLPWKSLGVQEGFPGYWKFHHGVVCPFIQGHHFQGLKMRLPSSRPTPLVVLNEKTPGMMKRPVQECREGRGKQEQACSFLRGPLLSLCPCG